MPEKKQRRSGGHGALLVIALFKFVKGSLLLVLAFGALSLLHKNVAAEVEHWLDQLQVDEAQENHGAPEAGDAREDSQSCRRLRFLALVQ